MTTPNLGLTTYNTVTDASSVLVYSYFGQVSGSNATQNLGILDSFAGSTSYALEYSASAIALALARANDTTSATIQIVPPSVDVDLTTGSFVLTCPSDLNGMSLYRAQGFLNTSTTGSYVIKVYNQTTSASMLMSASPIIIQSGNEIGTPATINPTSASVVTDDKLLIYLSGSPAVAGQGLQVVLEFIAL